MALATGERQAKPRRADGGEAVDVAFDAVFFRINAAFTVEKRLQVKGCGEASLRGRVRDEVASNL